MSTSQSNLPAVPEPIEPPLLDERTKKTLGDVRLLLALGATSLVAVFGGGWAAYAQVQSTGERAVDAGLAPVITATAALRSDLEQHKADEAQRSRELLRLVNELAADNRAIYRTIQTGERQYRLERPLPLSPDGGP